MSKIMSPSEIKPITPGQAGKFYDVLVSALCKSGLPSEPTQQILESQGAALADEFVVSVCKRVDAISDMIVRRVKVHRSRSQQYMLDATDRKQYTDRKVVNAMPKDGCDEDDVFFFKPDKSAYDKNGLISDDNLAKEYELRGLKPDPYAQAAVNEADPAFADDHPNGTHWKDKDGNWCYAAFLRWHVGERRVSVDRYAYAWYDRWFFAGVRK